MSLFVNFWGTRGSIPTPGFKTKRFGGNTSCVEVRAGETLLICDAGTGLRELGLDLASRGLTTVEAHMFFSHTHWDHIQGFPFFIPAYAPTTTLNVYEVSPSETRFENLLRGQMASDHFPVSFSDLGSRIVAKHFDAQGQVTINDVQVACLEQTHPGQSFAYSFEYDGKKIIYATDSEIDLTLENPDEVAEDLTALRRSPAKLVEFVRGADLLIADGQYTDDEYPNKVGWGHARANTVVDLAIQADVKQCAIFHHDPLHSDKRVEEIVDEGRARARAAGSDVQVLGAREGLELKI